MKQINIEIKNNSYLGNNEINAQIRGEIFAINTPEIENIDTDISKINIKELVNKSVKEEIEGNKRGLK